MYLTIVVSVRLCVQPLSEVLTRLPEERKKPLYESVLTTLPAGSPGRKFVRSLRQLNTMYRYAEPQDGAWRRVTVRVY